MTLLYFLLKPWSFLTYLTPLYYSDDRGGQGGGGIRVAVFCETRLVFVLFTSLRGVLPIDDTHLYFMTIE